MDPKNYLLELFKKAGVFESKPEKLSTDSPLRKGEVELDVMNEFEQKCYAFLEEKKVEHFNLHQIIHTHKNPKDKECMEANKKHTDLHHISDAVQGLLAFSLHSRIKYPDGTTALGVRDGFKIVAVTKKKERKHPFSELEDELFEGFGEGFVIVRGGPMSGMSLIDFLRNT